MVWPLFCNATASLSWLFETHNSGRIGSPSVAGSMMRRRSSISVVSWLHRRRRPPPLRLTRPFGNGVASRSFRPRPMVERASPVILEIASRPPRPAARTSPAANTLRPRSSSFEPTDSHLCRIAFASIMPTRILPGRYFRNPGALSHLATSRQSKNRFICFGSLPKLIAAHSAISNIYEQNRIDQVEFNKIFALGDTGGFTNGAVALQNYRRNIAQLGEHPTCDILIRSHDVPGMFLTMDR